jgi:ribosomal protein S12 methylthiotransferase
MRRWGDGERFLSRIESIRAFRPDAAFRSNFIVGYPGETEEDHDQLLEFVQAAQLDWCGFFSYSNEEGTYAAGLDHHVDPALMAERLGELSELQDRITAQRRDALVGERTSPALPAPIVKHRRSTASSRCRRTCQWDRSTSWRSPRRRGRT